MSRRSREKDLPFRHTVAGKHSLGVLTPRGDGGRLKKAPFCCLLAERAELHLEGGQPSLRGELDIKSSSRIGDVRRDQHSRSQGVEGLARDRNMAGENVAAVFVKGIQNALARLLAQAR